MAIANSRNKKVSSCWLECGCVQRNHLIPPSVEHNQAEAKHWHLHQICRLSRRRVWSCLTSLNSAAATCWLQPEDLARLQSFLNVYIHHENFIQSFQSINIWWQQASAGHRIDYQRLGSAWVAGGLSRTEVCLTDHLDSSMLPGNNKRQWWLVTNYRVTKNNSAMQSTHTHNVQAWLSYTEVAVNQPQLKLHLYSTT